MKTSGIIKKSQYGKSFKGTRVSNVTFGSVDIDELYLLTHLLDMRDTDFSDADIEHVHFRYCDLRGANFDGTKFKDVYFHKCLFDTAIIDSGVTIKPFSKNGVRVNSLCVVIDFDNDNYIISFDSNCIKYPLETDGEELTGYKKIRVKDDVFSTYHFAVAKLRIPAYAERIVYINDKCRASCAQVVDIWGKKWEHYDTGESMIFRRDKCDYNVGHMVYADGFNDNVFIGCGQGIHFFLTENEAWNFRA